MGILISLQILHKFVNFFKFRSKPYFVLKCFLKVSLFYFGDVNEQYKSNHMASIELDIPGQIDLQVTLKSGQKKPLQGLGQIEWHPWHCFGC